MLHGEDPRYEFSLFERSVHAGSQTSFELRKRQGRQWFVIVPYSGPGALTATLSVDGGEPLAFTQQDDGSLVLFLDQVIQADQVLSLSVTGLRSDAYVILNHNMRDK